MKFPGGAALVGADGGGAWVLIDDGEVARLGPGIALCLRAGMSGVQVLVEEAVPGAAGIIARRASAFGEKVAVWRVDGRSLVAAEAALPLDVPMVAPDSSLVELFVAHGVEPVLEHGVLRGEVLGLEIARVVDGRLMVGVGRHDRFARAEMRPGEDPGAALDSALGAVMRWRRPGVARHAANTLARARWLRSILVTRPSVVGLASLKPFPPPLPWFDLPEAGSAPAIGLDFDGRQVVVVCSVGIDLDLVPTAADCRLLYGASPDDPLWLIMPAGDDVPMTRRLAGMLLSPASVVTVTRDWESLAAEP